MTSPTALPQIVTGSLESLSHSSLPSTPSSTHTLLPNTSTQSLPIQRGFEPARPHQLPRILPLESRDTSKSHLAALISEPTHYGTNPRRSGTNSPASFLRQETSKSSTSSVLSGGSGGSFATPITPTDDYRPLGRSLPPPPLLTHTSSGSAPFLDLVRQHTTSPTAQKPLAEQGGPTPLQASGIVPYFSFLIIPD